VTVRRIPSTVLALLAASGSAAAQAIDFETLPDGSPTTDQQTISNEYDVPPYGVSFEIVDSAGGHVGFPKLAKVGFPRTAFQGCLNGDDLPSPHGQTLVGQTFLTDDGSVGLPAGELLVTYSSPVASASGHMVDVDRGPGQYEEWVITAYDAGGGVVDTFTLIAPDGPDTPCASGPGVGSGEGAVVLWQVDSPGGAATISSIRFAYTGTVTGVGIAFDNFSPSAIVPIPTPALPAWGIGALLVGALAAGARILARQTRAASNSGA
jgi:hypothetical protein